MTRLIDLGAKHFRVDVLDEKPAVGRSVIQHCQQMVAGEITGTQR
jgi:hypothetical protein